MEQMRNAYKILAGKPEGRSPFGRTLDIDERIY
jgi:hypothetical protein